MKGRVPTTSIGRPDRKSVEMIRDLILGMCLDGECYELAIALSRGTGLQMVGIWDPLSSGDDGKPGTWQHAVVRMEEQMTPTDHVAPGFVAVVEFGTPIARVESK